MKIGEALLKLLDKRYEPLQMVQTRFSRYDLAFKTDEAGQPMLLFIGKKDEHGKIKGEHFARKIVKDTNGVVIKDHWDNKGKTG